MQSSTLFPALLVCLAVGSAAPACPVVDEPSQQALVASGLSSLQSDISLSVFGAGDSASCNASLTLTRSELASRSLVPRPREIVADLGPAAEAYGLKLCSVTVFFVDDSDPGTLEGDDCWHGIYRYADGLWLSEDGDQRCW